VFTFVAERTRRCPKTGRKFIKGQRYPMTYYGIGTNKRRKWPKAGVDARIHDTRHTTGQRTLRATGNLRLVQQLFGTPRSGRRRSSTPTPQWPTCAPEWKAWNPRKNPRLKFIYAPKGQAGEYAPLATNPYRGCGHGCAYCYVPLVTKQPRPEFDAGAVERADFLKRLIADAKKYEAAGITEQVMLSFTTDPYHLGDTRLTSDVLHVLAGHGLAFCTLTKGGTRALNDIRRFRPDRDAFASTLTSLDERFSRKWERNAADPANRLSALRSFHERGIFTWVSLEPTLDVEASLAVIDATHEFVDLYKVGQANYLKEITRTTDWRDYTLRVTEKLRRHGKRHYIKRDLQCVPPPVDLNKPIVLAAPPVHANQGAGR
jgi:DNA repair photolyase